MLSQPHCSAVSSQCPVCRTQRGRFETYYSGKSELFQDVSIFLCENCGMHYATPSPSPFELESYNEKYFLNAHGGTDFKYSPFFTAIAKSRMRQIQKFINDKQVTVNSVIEYGPGRGDFAMEWLRKNPWNRYYVVETDKLSLSHLEEIGCRVLEKPVFYQKNNNLIGRSAEIIDHFDLAVMSHVLEHVAEPREFLSHAFDKLNPGGVLFVEVPCLDFLFKDSYEPHLLFFDKPQLERALIDVGFSSISISYHGRSIQEEKARTWIHQLMDKLTLFLLPRFLSITSLNNYGSVSRNLKEEELIVKIYKADVENRIPSLWLRAVCTKPIYR